MKTYEKYATFAGRILIIGFGSIGSAIFPLLLRHLDTSPSRVTVLEQGENEAIFEERFQLTGASYVRGQIRASNLDATLSNYLSAGDLCVDCSLNVDGLSIIEWCLQHDVLYINTSIERWKTEPDETIPDPAERTLFHSHQLLDALALKYPNAATSCPTHGANPGLVSHFCKRALLDCASARQLDVQVPKTRAGWRRLTKLLGIKIIQIAERDTQQIDDPKKPGEFVNTWSCEGAWAEGRAPSELAWGTHEKLLPADATVQGQTIFLAQPGMATLVKSWVPLTGQYNGLLIQHSEAITISNYLGTPANSITVYYAYCLCDSAIASFYEIRGNELSLPVSRRVAKDEITAGADELGVLLLGASCRWYGSQLDINEARDLVPHESATSLQVVASMLGAIVWAIKNPREGIVLPDELPFQEILEVALPYLGPMVSVETTWNPLTDRTDLFKQALDAGDEWQFQNFLVTNV